MEKRSMDDITPNGERRSITRIPLPESKLRVRRETLKEVYENDEDDRPIPLEPKPSRSTAPIHTPVHTPPPSRPAPRERETHFSELEPKKKRKFPWMIVLISILIIAVLVFLFTTLLSAAKLVVTAHSEKATVDAALDADSADDASIHYETIVTTKEGDKTVDAAAQPTTASSTGEKIETKATGKIIVYNDYTTSTEHLVATTRFQTAAGLVFRTPTAITIPGKTTSGGKDVPGSVEVTVVADKAGANYNIGLSDFTLPGFSGTPQAKTIYARSKTEMTGGFSGVSADQGASAAARTSLREELRTSLLAEAKAKVPQGSLAYNDGSFVSYQSLPNTTEAGKTVVHENATVTLFIFKKDDIDAKLIAIARPQLASTSLNITGDDALNFTFLNNQATSSVTAAISGTASSSMATVDKNPGPIHFDLKGDLGITWKYDPEALKKELVGIKKRGIDQVLSRYPAIEKADVILRPFWKTSFPNDPSKITIEDITNK